LPTDVVESSVKTILLKMRWIDLISSAIFFLPLCFAPLTFASFESSLLTTSLSSRSARGWTISCLYPNRFVSSEGLHCQCEQASLVGGVEKKPLVSGVARINTVYKDLIVYPTPSPP
jgi:hypothetical protein